MSSINHHIFSGWQKSWRWYWNLFYLYFECTKNNRSEWVRGGGTGFRWRNHTWNRTQWIFLCFCHQEGKDTICICLGGFGLEIIVSQQGQFLLLKFNGFQKWEMFLPYRSLCIQHRSLLCESWITALGIDSWETAEFESQPWHHWEAMFHQAISGLSLDVGGNTNNSSFEDFQI